MSIRPSFAVLGILCAVSLGGCKAQEHPSPREDSLEQSKFIQGTEFLVDDSRPAIELYIEAIGLLHEAGLSETELEKLKDTLGPSYQQALSEISDKVVLGARKSHLGLPGQGLRGLIDPLTKNRTEVQVGASSVRIGDLRLLALACLVSAQRHLGEGDSEAAMRLCKAMMAAGIQLMGQSDEVLVRAQGLSFKRYAVEILGLIGKKTGDGKIADMATRLREATRREFEAFRRENPS